MELLALAIAPVAVILFWVYHKDRYEPEPMSLIFTLMALGAVACLPAAGLELIAKPLLLHKQGGWVSLLIYAVLGIGLVEEGCKFFVLKRATWRHPCFTQRFDGIVYAVSASLGFAVLENILYVTTGGFSVGVLRALTAVPMHTVFGILMGLQYGRARFSQAAARPWKAVIIPSILHGLYDFFAMASASSPIFLWALGVLLVGSVSYALRLVIVEARNPY